ncbi:MAG: hypothetical protein NTX98_01280 [Candidatus Doudnabacteria bacterium]|nr:hypothetical protein [Candidatus Doudnabacteria bacterium]
MPPKNFDHHRTRTRPEEHERPRKIRIVKTPPGEMLEEVRRQWVGIEIPLAAFDDKARYTTGTSLGKPQDENGYEVLAIEAIDALQNKCIKLNEAGKFEEYEKAHMAWQVWFNSRWNADGVRLVFAKDCCELIG